MDVDTTTTTATPVTMTGAAANSCAQEEIKSPEGKVYTDDELDLGYLDRLDRPETTEEYKEWLDKYMYVQEMPLKRAVTKYRDDDHEPVTLSLLDDLDEKKEPKQIVTNRRFLRKCETLRIMYEDLKSESGEYPAEAIPVANVSSEVINLMITYCKWKDDNPPYFVHEYKENPPDVNSEIEEYNKTFFYSIGNKNHKGRQEWFPLLAACMYLDCQEMQGPVAEKLAHHIKGRMPDEVCLEFGEDPKNVPEEVKKAILDNNLFCEERDE